MSPFEPIKLGEMIPEKTCQALRELGWADPNEVHNSKWALRVYKDIMMINFGPKGRVRPNLLAGYETLEQMIVVVFQFYEERLREVENESGSLPEEG